MSNIFKKMAEMQKQMANVQEMVGRITATSEAGGGMIKVTATGSQRIVKVELDPDIVDPEDIEMLQDLIIAGVNKALEEAGEAAQNELRDQAGNFLPKNMDLSKFGL